MIKDFLILLFFIFIILCLLFLVPRCMMVVSMQKLQLYQIKTYVHWQLVMHKITISMSWIAASVICYGCLPNWIRCAFHISYFNTENMYVTSVDDDAMKISDDAFVCKCMCINLYTVLLLYRLKKHCYPKPHRINFQLDIIDLILALLSSQAIMPIFIICKIEWTGCMNWCQE